MIDSYCSCPRGTKSIGRVLAERGDTDKASAIARASHDVTSLPFDDDMASPREKNGSRRRLPGWPPPPGPSWKSGRFSVVGHRRSRSHPPSSARLSRWNYPVDISPTRSRRAPGRGVHHLAPSRDPSSCRSESLPRSSNRSCEPASVSGAGQVAARRCRRRRASPLPCSYRRSQRSIPTFTRTVSTPYSARARLRLQLGLTATDYTSPMDTSRGGGSGPDA